MDEIEPAALQTLSEERRIVVSKLIRGIAVLCFVYGVHSRYLGEPRD